MKENQSLSIIAIVSWLIALSMLDYIPPRLDRKDAFENPLLLLPERLRSFIAGQLWERADHLMHRGPVVDGQKFSAGTYAGNTDIVPLLKLVIALCPEEVAPYRLLATNYAYHLGMRAEAYKVLNKAKKDCAKNKNYHEIFAAEAFIRIFSQNSKKERDAELKRALELMRDAIDSYMPDNDLPDPAFKLENYYAFKARLHWELKEPERALETWEDSKVPLESSDDLIAKLILDYKETGNYQPLTTN